MRPSFNTADLDENISPIGQYAINIVDSQDKNTSVLLMQHGIKEGLFKGDSEEIAENLLFIIVYSEFPEVMLLAVRKLVAMNFESDRKKEILGQLELCFSSDPIAVIEGLALSLEA